MNLPNIKDAPYISIDVETYDPNIKDKGPGGVRGDGHLLGVSIAVPGWNEYLPFRHPNSDNLDIDIVRPWLRDNLGSNIDKIGANILYDCEWLRVEHINVGGKKYDVQIAEALLDEDRFRYNLDTLASDYLGETKDHSIDEIAKRIGKKFKDSRELLYCMTADEVAPYARKDTLLPPKIFNIQKVELEKQGLWDCFQMETDLLEVVLDMRFLGVPVDLDRAEQVKDILDQEFKTINKRLSSLAGGYLNIYSSQEIARACDRLGLRYPVFSPTAKMIEKGVTKGNPSFTADWLANQTETFFDLLLKARKLDRVNKVYVQDKIINMAVNDRVYPSFHTVKGDRGGTGAGRFSSSNPNFQQVPSRDPYLGPLVRSIIIPEHGCEWLKADYSQQEPRITIHYAVKLGLPGAAEALRRYREDPRTDYHQMTADMAKIERKPAKAINLGLTYGMGKIKLAAQLGLDEVAANELFNTYHSKVPYVKALTDQCKRVAMSRGYIRTMSGRRKRFQLFGPSKYDPEAKAYKLEEAIKQYGPSVKKWFLHKSLNSLIQGTAADMNKQAMIDCHREGFTPHLTVHDENDFSIGKRSDAFTIKKIMEQAMLLEVPVICDAEVGPNWGEVEKL